MANDEASVPVDEVTLQKIVDKVRSAVNPGTGTPVTSSQTIAHVASDPNTPPALADSLNAGVANGIIDPAKTVDELLEP